MDRRLAAVREAAEQRKRQLEEERKSREVEEQRQRSEAEAERAREQAAVPAEDEGGPSAVLIGGLAGALLLVVIVAVVLARRRALPRDLDVDAFEGTGDEAGPFDDEEHAEDVEPSAPTKREPLFAPDDRAAEPLSVPGLFDEPEKGESGMETRVQDLQIGRKGPGVAPPPGPDLSNALADLERRMSALESKLQEANAARERLERQVAAQSEELRVQRAAIARTQRALRGLSRSEEEQATEPALRD
jgi:hypothetical protein